MHGALTRSSVLRNGRRCRLVARGRRTCPRLDSGAGLRRATPLRTSIPGWSWPTAGVWEPTQARLWVARLFWWVMQPVVANAYPHADRVTDRETGVGHALDDAV